jgi:hypothetical protein
LVEKASQLGFANNPHLTPGNKIPFFTRNQTTHESELLASGRRLPLGLSSITLPWGDMMEDSIG